MVKAGCIFHSVDQHWANPRIHENQKISDVTGRELVRLACDQVIILLLQMKFFECWKKCS
jgi:hypothetical protein